MFKGDNVNTRKYLIKEQNGLFVLAISQSQNYFIGTVIWYNKSGEWTENSLKTDWHTENFLESSHDEVYKKSMEWVIEHLGEPIEVEEITK